MPKLERNIILDFGKTGMGKTVWAKNYLKTQKRVVLLDPQNEYDNYLEFENANDLFNYIKERKIFRVKCCDLREFSKLCLVVSFVPKTLLVIEESQRILAPRLKIPEEFEDVIYRGRHTETSVLLIAQRAKTIDIAIRSQFDQMIVFKQSEKGDLDWISDVTGIDLNEEIQNLKVLEYLHITNTGLTRSVLKLFS